MGPKPKPKEEVSSVSCVSLSTVVIKINFIHLQKVVESKRLRNSRNMSEEFNPLSSDYPVASESSAGALLAGVDHSSDSGNFCSF